MSKGYHDGDLVFKDGALHLYLKHSSWTDEEYRLAYQRMGRYIEAYLRTRKDGKHTNPSLYGDNPVPPKRVYPLPTDDRGGGTRRKGG